MRLNEMVRLISRLRTDGDCDTVEDGQVVTQPQQQPYSRLLMPALV